MVSPVSMETRSCTFARQQVPSNQEAGGDKPAPAMAQIALRKTADEAKEDISEAAKVLKDNTYADDICDSVRTEEEARELTKCIDSVLETRGFKVKYWLSNKAKKSNTDQKERKEAAILQGVTEEKVLGTTVSKYRPKLTFSGTSRKIDFAHISFIDRS